MSEEHPETATDPNVEEAYQHISGILQQKYAETLEEVGDYLLEKFFNNDYQKIYKNEHSKEGPFLQLVRKIQDNHGQTPSKSWLYNAIRVAADKKHFDELGNEDYRNLGISQKVKLTTIQDPETKKQIVGEIKQDNFETTVKDLEVKINKLKKSSKQRRSLLDILKNQDLDSTPLSKLRKHKESTDKKISNIQEQLNKYQETLDEYKEGKKRIEDEIQKKENKK